MYQYIFSCTMALFIIKIVEMLDWGLVACESARMLRSQVDACNAGLVAFKEEALNQEKLQQPTCPLISSIAQIMVAVHEQPMLRHCLIFEVAHVMHAAGNAIDKELLSTINKILLDKLSIRSFCYQPTVHKTSF